MGNKSAINEINVLKGIAISFVVIRHLPLNLSNFYINISIDYFKDFMHLFMFASGFLYGKTGPQIYSLRDYCSFIKKKVKRLLIPYLSVALSLLAIKFIAGFFTPLAYPVNKYFWKYIFINPIGGYATFLWFLYVLFIIFMIFPIIERITTNSFILIFLISLIHISSYHNEFYQILKYAQYYLLFFCLGYLYSKTNPEKDYNRSKYLSSVLCTTFLVLFIWRYLYIKDLDRYDVFSSSALGIDSVVSILGLFSFYYLSIEITRKKNLLFHVLDYIGHHSASIYLFHSTFIGGMYFILLKFIPINNYTIKFLALMVFLSGIIFPILATKYILYKNRHLSFCFLGIDIHYPKSLN